MVAGSNEVPFRFPPLPLPRVPNFRPGGVVQVVRFAKKKKGRLGTASAEVGNPSGTREVVALLRATQA